MFIDVREKYPHCAWGFKRPKTIGPLDDDRCVGIIEDLIKTEAVERAGLDAVQVDVVNLHAAGVLIDECEGWAGNLVDVGHAETIGKALSEEGLPRPEIAIQEDVGRSLESRGKL